MTCEHNSEYECHDCTEARHAADHPVPVTGCLACKLASIQVSARIRPRSMKVPAVTESKNSWERGIATDERGVPFLGKGMTPIGVKEYGERRHEIEAHRRRLRQGDLSALAPPDRS